MQIIWLQNKKFSFHYTLQSHKKHIHWNLQSFSQNLLEEEAILSLWWAVVTYETKN